MWAKVEALIAKLEGMVHGVIDTVTAGVTKLNSVEKIALAVLVAALVCDVVSGGKFGVMSFAIDKINALKDVILDIAKAGLAGVALVGIGYLIVKEAKK